MNDSTYLNEAAADGENPERARARQVLLDAASLSGWCLSYWRDEQVQAFTGERIVYAIDVDILKMYSDSQGHRSSGCVFSQADDVSDLIAGLAADYVLHRLHRQQSDKAQDRKALLLIPPHGAELRVVVEAIANAQAQAAAADSKHLKDVTRNLHTHLIDASDSKAAVDIFLEFLSENASEVHNLLLGKSGAAAEMARLNMLPEGRLAGPSAHSAFAGESALSIPPSRFGSGAETKAMLVRCDEWYELMLGRSVQLSPFRRSKLDDDAWVLASLEWINADAFRRGLPVRVVLISATQRLHSAGSRMPASHLGYDNFAEAYLRDPRSFLGARDFFAIPRGETKGETEFRILEWMSVLFPTSIQQGRAEHARADGHSSSVTVTASLKEIRAIAAGSSVSSALDILLSSGYRQTQGSTFPEGALEEWRDVVRDTHAQVILKRQEKAQSHVLESLLEQIPESKYGRLDHLMARLAKQVQQSFTGLFLATGVIGVDQLLELGTKRRGVPALRFDLPEYADAQTQCDALADELFKSNRKPMPFDLAKMYEALAKSDDSNYHAHVLHAFVYASTGLWFTARTLCRVALLVVDMIPSSQSARRTGREAAYLLAVAERRLATKAESLRIAGEALAQARRRAVGDEALDPRFDGEALAQKITLFQLEYYKGGVKVFPDMVSALHQALRLCATVLGSEQPRILRRWVVRQSCTNGLIAAILAEGAGLKKPQVVGQARELIKIMEEEGLAPSGFSSNGSEQKYADEISDFVWMVAVAIFDGQKRASDARLALEDWIPPQQNQALLAYEVQRFHHFLRLAGCEPREVAEVRSLR